MGSGGAGDITFEDDRHAWGAANLIHVRDPGADDAIAEEYRRVERALVDQRIASVDIMSLRSAPRWGSSSLIAASDLDDGTADLLLTCLAEVTTFSVGVRIVGHFTTKSAAPLAPRILELFEAIDDNHLRWEIGRAFFSMASVTLAHLAPEVERLLLCPHYDRGREMLAEALPKLGVNVGVPAAIRILGADPQIDGHLFHGLKKRGRALVPIEKVKMLARDERAWVSRMAKRELALRREQG